MPIVLDGTTGITAPNIGGSTTVNSAVDVTLTSLSTQVQYVNMSATGKYVILPNATTMTRTGDTLFSIYNSGGNEFGVKDADGRIIIPAVRINKPQHLSLINNSTSKGLWANQDAPLRLHIKSIQISPNSHGQFAIQMVWLSDTVGLFVSSFGQANQIFNVVTLSAAGGTATWATPSARTLAGYIRYIIPLSSTSFIVMHDTFSSPFTINATAFTISGTTLTQGTTSVLFTGTSNNRFTSAVFLSSTAVMVNYYKNNNRLTTACRVLTVSGTTITQGAEFTTTVIDGLGPLTSTTVVGCVRAAGTGGSTNDTLVVLSVAGTTITAGTPLANTTSYLQEWNTDYYMEQQAGIKISSTQVFMRNLLVTVSGTTISSVSQIPINRCMSVVGTNNELIAAQTSYDATVEDQIYQTTKSIQTIGLLPKGPSSSPQASNLTLPSGLVLYDGWMTGFESPFYETIADANMFYVPCTNNGFLTTYTSASGGSLLNQTLLICGID